MARGVATVGGSLVVSRLSKIIVEMLIFELVAGTRATHTRHIHSLGIAFDIVDRLSILIHCIRLMV